MKGLNSLILGLSRPGCMGAAGTGAMMHTAWHMWCSAAVHLCLQCGHLTAFNACFVVSDLVHPKELLLIGNTLQGQLVMVAANRVLAVMLSFNVEDDKSIKVKHGFRFLTLYTNSSTTKNARRPSSPSAVW